MAKYETQMPRNARVEEHVEDALLAAHTKGIEARPRNGAEDEWAPGPYRAAPDARDQRSVGGVGKCVAEGVVINLDSARGY